MTELTDADQIWNRACAGDVLDLFAGDRALADLLAFHGSAMNGGVLDASENFEPTDLRNAEFGYRFFDLVEIADLINEAVSSSKTDDELEQWEAELDARYNAVIPDDSALVARFEMILRRRPWDFAPL